MDGYVFKGLKVRWLIFWFIVSILSLFFFAVYFSLDLNNSSVAEMGQVWLYLSVFIWLVVSFQNFGIDFKRMVLNKNRHPIPWMKFFLLEVLTTVVSFGILFLVILILLLLNSSIAMDILHSPDSGSGFSFSLLNFVIMVFLAPVVEELLFRGYLFNKWGESIGVKKAMVFSSLLFAVLHLEGAFISQFIGGILYCLIYMRTKNLVVPMVLHMFHNGLVFVGLYFSSLSTSTTQVTIDIEAITRQIKFAAILTSAVILVLLSVTIILLRRLYKDTDKQVPYLSNI